MVCEIKFAHILSLWHGGGGFGDFQVVSNLKKVQKSLVQPGFGEMGGGGVGLAVSGYFYIFSRTSKMSPIFAKVPIFKLGCSIGIRWWLHVNS